MNNKLAFGFGLLLGVLGVYAWATTKLLSAQEKITELSKPPRKITKRDWWENHEPNSADGYKITKARADWLTYIFSTFIFPYIDKNVASLLVHEFLTPLDSKMVDLELEQQNQERLTELMLIQKTTSHRADD